MEKKHAVSSVIVCVATAMIITCCLILITSSKHNYSICNHKYGDWEILISPSEFSCGEKIRYCNKCNQKESERIFATCTLPQIYFDGSLVGINKDNEVYVSVTYMDEKTKLSMYASIKYQGHTSMTFEKKNYTIKLFEDEQCKTKKKIALHNWTETNKYCLKANYIDYSQARNIVSNQIWTEVVESRSTIISDISSLEFFGAINGYPVVLFINNEYQGLHTMNIPKDEKTYNIADEPNEAMFVLNSPMSDSSLFKAELTESDKKNIWELEYCYGDDESQAYESLNNLLSFVINNDGESFVRNAEKYFDVSSAIDYLATAYYLGLTDNFNKNIVLFTFDGQQWIFNLYDLDTACGLIFDGSGFRDYNELLPVINTDGKISSSTDNLFWDRILNNFGAEFAERYFELRNSVLCNEQVVSMFKDYIESIPDSCYKQELLTWSESPLIDVNNVKQIEDYLFNHSHLLDSIINDIL